MATPARTRRSLTLANSMASNAIDQLLNRGAEKLYHKYISAKIPPDLSTKLADFISVVFDPVTNTNQQGIVAKEERVHESVIAKPNLAQ
jgi:glutathionyl-hydroquinone reductase